MASFIVYGDASGQVTVAAPAVAGSNTITFPAETGTLITSAYTGTALPGQIAWDTTVKTSGFTAVAYGGYFCNTTSAAFTVTLPATPTRGQFVVIVDYAGTAATNNIVVNPNGGKINSSTAPQALATNRQGITFTYIDSTQGWLASSNVYGGSTPFVPVTYTASYLIVGGGAAGGVGSGAIGAGGGGAGGYITGTTTLTGGTSYTITVGGAGAVNPSGAGGLGGDSSFPGATTAKGGGGGGSDANPAGNGGLAGGSGGGGGGRTASTSGGAGTPGQGNAGAAGQGPNNPVAIGGGGGGATAAGSGATGGAGTASSITGTPATYSGGGGGGGGGYPSGGSGAGSGGAGGGGAGSNSATPATAGTTNTGGGGGGGGQVAPFASGPAGAGGSGVVILSVPTSNYSGTTTGSPTVTTSGSNTILKYTASGTYTAQGIIMAKMTIEELIKEFSNEQGFQFGIDIVMKSLRPGALYGLSASGGTFEIVSWDETNELPPPSSQEIRDEYIRHQTIKEFLDHLQEHKELHRKLA